MFKNESKTVNVKL